MGRDHLALSFERPGRLRSIPAVLALIACAALGPLAARADDGRAEEDSAVAASDGTTAPEAATNPNDLEAQLAEERAARLALEGQVRDLAAMVARLESQNAVDAVQLDRMRASVEGLAAQAGGRGSAVVGSASPGIQRVSAPDGGPPTDGGPAPAGGTADGTPPASDGQERVGIEKEQPRFTQAERDILEREGGVLVPPGQLVIESGFQYTQAARDKLQVSGFSLIPAIIIGRFELSNIQRNAYAPFLSLRYGVADWLEVAAEIPYYMRTDRYTFTEGTDPDTNRLRERQVDIDGSGIGDITFGFNTQVAHDTGGWIPDTLVRFLAQAPTGRSPFDLPVAASLEDTELAFGQGTWGFAPGFTLAKTVDPVVVYIGGGYTWNLSENISGIGTYDPGDAWQYNLGFTLALNERMAMNLSLSDRIISKTKIAGQSILRTDANAATLFAGLTYSLTRELAMNFSVGVGITKDAPDFQLEMRLPFRLPYRGPSLKSFAFWRDSPSETKTAVKKGPETATAY
jgi:opacity protein-like surface antigen